MQITTCICRHLLRVSQVLDVKLLGVATRSTYRQYIHVEVGATKINIYLAKAYTVSFS